MPEGVTLHIRTRDHASVGVLPMRGTSVRVGRSRRCEVFLPDPSLADVECLLRRRGESWHVQPVGRSSKLLLEGRGVVQQRPLPLGVSLRVGHHWLTLLPTGVDPMAEGAGPQSASHEYDVYLPGSESDARVEAVVVSRPRLRASDAEAELQVASAGLEVKENDGQDHGDHLDRWNARMRQRERWIEERKREHLWETRWRAAGEAIRQNGRRPTVTPTQPHARTTSPPKRKGTSAAPAPRKEVQPEKPEATPRALRIAAEPPPNAIAEAKTPSTGGDLVVRPKASPPATERAVPTKTTALPGPIPPKPLPGPLTAPRSLAAPAIAMPGRAARGLPTPNPVEPPSNSLVLFAQFQAWSIPSRVDSAESFTTSLLESAFEAEFDAITAAEFLEIEPEPEFATEPAAFKAPIFEEPTWLEDRLSIPEHDAVDDVVDSLLEHPSEPTIDLDSARVIVIEPAATTDESVASTSPLEIEAHVAVEPESEIDPEPELDEEPSEVKTTLQEPSGPAEDQEPVLVEKPEVAPLDPSVTAWMIPKVVNSRGKDRPIEDAGPEAQSRRVPVLGTEPPKSKRPFVDPKRESDWPSAKSILAGRGPRVEPGRGVVEPKPVRNRWPVPTESAKPAHWSVPGAAWFCLPGAFLTLVVGLAATRMAWQWADADRTTGLLADRLIRLQDVPEPERKAIDGLATLEAALPEPSWTKATSDQIALRMAALARGGMDPDREARTASLLEAGRHTAPSHPSIRFALAWRSAQAGDAEPLGARLGLSRDVIPLTWSARQVLEAGHQDRALGMYREALELACQSKLSTLSRPMHRDEPNLKRFELPYEAMLGFVLREMIDAGRWSYEDWRSALPDFAVVHLSAARILAERGSPDAERALEQAVATSSQPAPDGCDPAVHLAAGSEAMAMSGRWDEAREGYERSIAMLGDPSGDMETWLKRSWSFNLADICARLGDLTRERDARRVALGRAPNDEITRLILRAQTQEGMDLFGPSDSPDSEPVDARSTYLR